MTRTSVMRYMSDVPASGPNGFTSPQVDALTQTTVNENEYSDFKANLRKEIAEIQTILKDNPSDSAALKRFSELQKGVEKVFNATKEHRLQLAGVKRDSQIDRVQLETEKKKYDIYIETQHLLAGLEHEVLQSKIKNNFNALEPIELARYFSDLDLSGGTQEANKQTSEGVLWWKEDKYAQKYIIGEKQLERTIMNLTGRNKDKISEMITRISGETSIDNTNHSRVREKFVKNILERTSIIARLTEGLGGEEYRTGLNAVLMGTEKKLITSILDTKKGQENAKDLIANGMISPATLTAIGLQLAVSAAGVPLVVSASQKKTGTAVLGEARLSSSDDGLKNITGKLSFFGVELQFNGNDRDSAIAMIREQRGEMFDGFLNEQKDGFDDAKINAILNMTDSNTKVQLTKTFDYYKHLLTSTTEPAQKKAILSGLRTAFTEAAVDMEMMKNTDWEARGISIGLALFIFPFIKLDGQKLSQELATGVRNKGTKLDAVKTDKKIADLGVTYRGTHYVVEENRYDAIEIDEKLGEMGVSLASNIITIPSGKTLSFAAVKDGATGARILRVVGTGEKQTTGKIDSDVKIEGIKDQELDVFLKNEKTRLALAEIGGAAKEFKSDKPDRFAQAYTLWSREGTGVVSGDLKSSAIAMLNMSKKGEKSRKELRILAQSLNDASPIDSLKIIESIRYGIMTDYRDMVSLKSGKYIGDKKKYESMLKGKSLSGKTFADALAGIPLAVQDFAGVIPDDVQANTLKNRIENNGRQPHPRMVAMVGTWKFNPPSMDYKGPGLARIATDPKGKEYLKDAPEDKKGDIYNAFATSPAFEKMVTDMLATANNDIIKNLTPTERKTLIVYGKVVNNDGVIIEMPDNKFSFFGYEACNNPSVGIEFGGIIKLRKDGVTTSISTAMETVENTLGSLSNTTTNAGIGLTGSSLMSGGKSAGGGGGGGANASTTPAGGSSAGPVGGGVAP